MSALSCVVLSCVGSGLAIGRSPIQRSVLKFINGFKISEFNYDSEQAGGANSMKLTTFFFQGRRKLFT
jgi:hypothetical protein